MARYEAIGLHRTIVRKVTVSAEDYAEDHEVISVGIYEDNTCVFSGSMSLLEAIKLRSLLDKAIAELNK